MNNAGVTSLVCLLLLSAPNADKLAAEYFEADAERRAAILKELEPVDALDADAVAKWRKKLLEMVKLG